MPWRMDGGCLIRWLECHRTMGKGYGVVVYIPTVRTQGIAVFGPLERVREVRKPFMTCLCRCRRLLECNRTKVNGLFVS